jgi:hypothetical protein
VDISIQYESDGETRVFGVEFGEINIKQRMVINHGVKSNEKFQEDELLCTLEDVSIYLGISSEEKKLETMAKNREILHKIRTIRKMALLEKTRIELYYNIHKKSVVVEVQEMLFKASKLTLFELAKIGEFLGRHLSDRPLLRPGQGDRREVKLGNETRLIREGTLKWWDYTISSVLDKILERRKNNFFSNHEYQKYLFCLFYRYTHGPSRFINEQIEHYEGKKLAKTTMEIYFNILSRIRLIRDSKKHEEVEDNFIKFLQCSERIKRMQKEQGLQRITYQAVRKSGVFINLQNCRAFMRETAFSNRLNIRINVLHIRLSVVESTFDVSLIEEGFKLPPSMFYSLKSKYISRYYKSIIEEPPTA